MQDQSPVGAAIDIGSNTIHIVVARATRDMVHILADEVELVRIGESVNATGAISPEKRDAAIAVLRGYVALAAQYQARPVLAVATEAIRKAQNGAEFLADVQRATGLAVQMVDGEVEAVLSFYGATYELFSLPDAPTYVGVMDLGGGSAELVTAKQKAITWRTSLPIGSGWLHDRYLPSNPPTSDEMDTARTFLQTFLQGVHAKRFPSALIVTGGSANTLLHLAHSAFGLREDQLRLTRDDLLRCEGLMSALATEELAQRYQQSIARAQILPAGALIVRMVMEHFHLEEIQVSPHGIREGMLLAYARDGEQWLERLRGSVGHGSSSKKVSSGGRSTKARAEDEPFASSGQRLLRDRTHKMLEWPDEVIKHDDSEAVHKMRVATRRLRATLDAYEIICQPRQFKRVYRQVKEIADLLGQARDTDVLIEHLQGQLEQVAPAEQEGMRWLIGRLLDHRQQQQYTLEAFFAKFDEKSFEKQVESSLFR